MHASVLVPGLLPAVAAVYPAKVVMLDNDHNDDTRYGSGPAPRRLLPPPGAVHTAVLTAAQALHAGQHWWPVHSNQAAMFILPPVRLTASELREADAGTSASRRCVSSWLPADAPLPA
jgi:hypothetical protein